MKTLLLLLLCSRIAFAAGDVSDNVAGDIVAPTNGGSVSSPVVAPAGTAAAPGLAVGTANKGIYDAGSNTLGFASSGASTATLDASGNFAAVGKVTGTNINATGIGAYESSAYTAGMYYVSELLGTEIVSTHNLGTGTGLYGSSGEWALPTGIGAAFIGPHPGFFYVATSALNDRGMIVLGNDGAYNFLHIYTTSPTTAFTYYFATPQVLSTLADRYVFNVGAIANLSGATMVRDGWYLSYSDNVNSGNWVLYEAGPSGPAVIANSSTAPVAATWNTLTITKSGTNTITAVLNGTQIASGPSAQLTATSPIFAGLGGIQLTRTTFTAGTINAFLDRVSIYQSVGTR